MLNKKCNNCGFQQNEFLNLGGRNYCKSCNSEISNNNTKIQDLDNLTAHDKKVVYDMFYMSIEWLEKYIEIAYKNELPDWESRRQIRDNLTITRTDIYSNPEKAKKAFSTQMFLFGTSLEDMPIFREDLKKEFRQWISAVKVDDSFPNELKHILYGFNEVMDGNIEKVRKDMANRKREYEIGSPGYMEKMTKLFASVQVPMHNEREAKKSLGNKTHLDVGFGNRFSGGSAEQGEQAFSQIAGSVASHHDDFHFYPQQGQQSNNPQQTGQLMDNGNIAVINDEVYLPVGSSEVDQNQYNIVQQDLRMAGNIPLNVPMTIGSGIAVALVGSVFNNRRKYFKKSLS